MEEIPTVTDLKAISTALDRAYYEDQRIPDAQQALATLAEVWTRIAALPEFRNAGEYILSCYFCEYTGTHEPDCLWKLARYATGQA